MNYVRLIAAYAVVVFLLHVVPTSMPNGNGLALSRMEFLSVRVDHLLHMLVFVPWMVLVWLHLNAKRIAGPLRIKHAFFWLLVGLLLAVCSESIQYWLPYRSFNTVDMGLNASGVLLGALVFALGRREALGRRGK